MIYDRNSSYTNRRVPLRNIKMMVFGRYQSGTSKGENRISRAHLRAHHHRVDFSLVLLMSKSFQFGIEPSAGWKTLEPSVFEKADGTSAKGTILLGCLSRAQSFPCGGSYSIAVSVNLNKKNRNLVFLLKLLCWRPSPALRQSSFPHYSSTRMKFVVMHRYSNDSNTIKWQSNIYFVRELPQWCRGAFQHSVTIL